MTETEKLLGKIVCNIRTNEVGTVRGVKALDLHGEPGIFVEVPVVTVRGQHPHMNRVWRVEDVEVVE